MFLRKRLDRRMCCCQPWIRWTRCSRSSWARQGSWSRLKPRKVRRGGEMGSPKSPGFHSHGDTPKSSILVEFPLSTINWGLALFMETSTYGGFHGGTPYSWMFYNGKSQSKMDYKWGTPSMEPPMYCSWLIRFMEEILHQLIGGKHPTIGFHPRVMQDLFNPQ